MVRAGDGSNGGWEEWKDGQGKSMFRMLMSMFAKMFLTILLDD